MHLLKKVKKYLLLIVIFHCYNSKAQVDKAQPNSNRDSVRYTKLRDKLNKSAIGREVYNFLFKDIYNQASSINIDQNEQNPYSNHSGKVIRSIKIKRLNVLGESVYDTTQKATVWYEKTLNKLHKNTQESVIRNSFLLFNEGDVIDAQLLWDNERLLRSTSIFHDAQILIVPDPTFSNIVDILIVTQDVWSLEPIIDVGGLEQYTLGLAQNNVRGLAHAWNTSFFYNKTQSPKWEFQSNYQIPYYKKTYIKTEASLSYFRDFKQLALKTSRQFITPDTKWAGSAELSRNQTNTYIFYKATDSLVSFPLNYNFGEVWLGRAFKVNFGSKTFQERSRVVLSGLSNFYRFTQRPIVAQDTNRLYSNRSTYLLGIGFTNRKYQRDLMIYGYGRTEDVPIGYLGSVVWGIEQTEFGTRNYLGLKFAKGSYLSKNRGYLYNLINIGGYRRDNEIEQGILSIESSYFSPLISWRKSKLRHFATFRYTNGYNRFDNEYVSISNNGIRGLNSSLLRGTQKMTLSLESVCFSPVSIIGFRIAYYGFADFGFINGNLTNQNNYKLYQGYGVGIRLRNENFTFNTISLRIGFYPTIPNVGSLLGTNISGEQILRLQDFNISAPEPIPFR
jgi:hypothetical protein